jgi:hypothetical protein
VFCGVLHIYWNHWGLYVMLWSFGPGILFLFLRDRYKAKLAKSGNIQESES